MMSNAVHVEIERPRDGEIQMFLWCDETESGFIIRPEDSSNDSYKAEEWRTGDIVDNYYGAFTEATQWTDAERQQHLAWRREEGLAEPDEATESMSGTLANAPGLA